MKFAVAEGFQNSHSYVKYRAIITDLLSRGKATGLDQSEALLHYTKLNEARMNRLDKKTEVAEAQIRKLLSLKKQYVWLLISEGWCGDAAQIVPVLNKIATLAPNIDLRVAFRDENSALMGQFLTNGARSIPKLVVLEAETLNVLGHWGPRPKGAQELISSYKAQYGEIDETGKTELQMWYLHDKGLSIQEEVTTLMTDLETHLYSKR